MTWEQRFRAKSSQQEGLIAKFQVRSLGCGPDDWSNMKASPRWELLSERVAAVLGTPETEARRVRAGVLDASPGAVLHGAGALGWFGVPGYDLRTLTVARPYGLNGAPSTLAEVHRIRALRSHDVIVVRGVATETPLRAIWAEAARYASPARSDIGAMRIGRLLDLCHRRGLLTWDGLAEMVDDIHQRGRAGTRLMRALSEARPPGSSVTESRQEDRLEELLDQHGARPLRRQILVGGHEPVGRTDHRDDQLPLVVETNSLTFHTTPSDQEADERRYAALNDAGFTVGVVWEPDLWSRPLMAVETVAAARRQAAAGKPVVVHSPGCPWAAPRFGPSEPIDAAHEWSRRLAS
jgi:hypothetical protein